MKPRALLHAAGGAVAHPTGTPASVLTRLDDDDDGAQLTPGSAAAMTPGCVPGAGATPRLVADASCRLLMATPPPCALAEKQKALPPTPATGTRRAVAAAAAAAAGAASLKGGAAVDVAASVLPPARPPRSRFARAPQPQDCKVREVMGA